MSDRSDANSAYLAELHTSLTQHFDGEDLRILCLHLGLHVDDLRGEGRASKLADLVWRMARQERLPELLVIVSRERPRVSWPAVPEDFSPPAGVSTEDQKQTGQAGAAATFNIGHIEAGQSNVGGLQIFEGSIEVDLSETHIHQPQDDVVMGDKVEMSGDFRGALMAIDSRLNHVAQTIGVLPHGDTQERATLRRLVDQLNEQLAQTPVGRSQEAERVVKRLEVLVAEVEAEEPDKDMVEIMGESLKRAAEKVADVLPAVLTIATQIADQLLRLSG